jgi:hypothetical protein
MDEAREPVPELTERTRRRVDYVLLVLLVLAALSYWAPWVDHRTAALKLSGQDLGEFVKFIPAMRTTPKPFPRQLFYLPPFLCAVSLVLLAANGALLYPIALRVGMLLGALLLLPGLLPPVWGHPRDLFAAEFRLQAVFLLAGLAVIASHGLFRRLAQRVLKASLGTMALAAVVPVQWAFWTARPFIWAVYDTPSVHLGWGLGLSAAAWFGIAITCAVSLRQHTPRSSIPITGPS